MKKVVVLLAAVLTFQKGQTVELDATVADELIAKGHAVEVDQSVRRRDHAIAPSADDLGSAIARALSPVVTEVKALADQVAEIKKAPRTKATNNAGGLVEQSTDPAAEPVIPSSPAAEPMELRIARAVAEGLAQRAQGRSGINVVGRADENTGLRLARYVRAAARAAQLGVAPEVVLREWGDPESANMVKAERQRQLTRNFPGMDVQTRTTLLQQSVLADGGALVPEQFSAELIPLLRNAAVIRQAGARVITMNGGNLTVPKGTGASTAAYVGEGQAGALSKPQLGNIKFAEKKMRVDVVLTNDLMRNAALSADAWVRDDMVRVAAIKETNQALFGVGSQYSPLGVERMLDSGNRFDSVAVDRTVATLAEIRKDLAKIIKKVKQSNILSSTSKKLGWLMNARFESYLGGLTDGNGNAVFLQGGLDDGMLRGFPVFFSEVIPDTLANFAANTTDECRVFFGDWDSFVIAESTGGMEVQVFPNGTYEDPSGTAVSGAARDETYVRLILLHDFNMRYTNAIVDSSHRPA